MSLKSFSFSFCQPCSLMCHGYTNSGGRLMIWLVLQPQDQSACIPVYFKVKCEAVTAPVSDLKKIYNQILLDMWCYLSSSLYMIFSLIICLSEFLVLVAGYDVSSLLCPLCPSLIYVSSSARLLYFLCFVFFLHQAVVSLWGSQCQSCLHVYLLFLSVLMSLSGSLYSFTFLSQSQARVFVLMFCYFLFLFWYPVHVMFSFASLVSFSRD